MGGSARLSNFCVSRIATLAMPPTLNEAKQLPRNCCISAQNQCQHNQNCRDESNRSDDMRVGSPRKVLVVVDSSPQAKHALLWALSHTLQDQDHLLLLHVVKPKLDNPNKLATGNRASNKKECETETGEEKFAEQRQSRLLESLKLLSKSRKPKVEVEASVVEGKEKGPTIVSQARKQGASLLVLGQRKPSLVWRMFITWAGTRAAENGGSGDVVDYCIQNADCMTVAVRRKSRKGGGYLITTRRQKNFWLLA